MAKFFGAASPDQSINAAIRRYSLRYLENQYGGPGPFNQSRPVTDPQNQTSASLHSLNTGPRIAFGIITDSTAVANAYRVQFEKGKQPMVACLNPGTTVSTYGTREINTLQPGTMVGCIIHDQFKHAHIFTVIPPPHISSRNGHTGILHGATRNRVDEAHKRPLRSEAGGGVISFNAGRPLDSTHAGEVGWITETGLRFMLDSFMGMFGVDESCQLSFHYHDMLCRLAAYQFQHWTACRETESLNDQDETQDWTGYAMYPWEGMGLAARADPTRILSPAQWQLDEPHYGKMEPLDDYMMPFHREREWHGYLGQGRKHALSAPPVEFTDSGDMGSRDTTDTAAGARTQYTAYAGGAGVTAGHFPGLYDQFITADGRVCTQAAKGLSFAKRSNIILPVRKRRPEDKNGDTPENYAFSGVVGDGDEHQITGDIETTGEHSGFSRAMGVMDMHAYFFNYAGLHPFFYHKEDYHVYEESESSWTSGTTASTPDFSTLASTTYIDPEDYRKTWNIDHRYGVQQFYTLESGLDFLDDGGVMLYDGYGASIRMAGGAVEISAPGDIWCRSGRNTNIWAGYDAVIRAKHSWDITATEYDGRLKAERNLFQLSGNGGTGGTLIESRGSGPVYDFEEEGEAVIASGVMIRSVNAPCVTWGQSIYMRTGGPDFSAGPIIMDAGKGEGQISLYGQAVNNFITSGEFWHFNTIEGQVDGPTAAITDAVTTLPGVVMIGGELIGNGSAVFDGSVSVTGGYAAVECPMVGCLEGDALASVVDIIQQAQNTLETEYPQIGQTFLDNVLQPQFYDAARPGNDDVISKAQFSLRTQENYKTEQFVLYEDRWQQLGRLASQSLPEWNETAVLYRGQATYPYPGKEAFENGGNYIQQELTMFDPQTGRSKDRGDQPDLQGYYAAPTFGEQKPASLNTYTVIR